MPISATRMTAWESIELLGWPILMAKKKTASVPRIIRGRAIAVYQPLPGWSQAMMPKYMAMPRPSRSNVIRKTALVGKKIGRQKIHRTIQVPMT